MRCRAKFLSPLTLIAFLAGCNPVEFFRNPNAAGAPASDTWVEVRHPSLPLTFEMPENAQYRKDGSAGLSRMGQILGPRGEIQHFDDWGIRTVFDAGSRIHALEFSFARLTPASSAVDERTIAALHANLDDPEAAMQFVRDVYLGGRAAANVEFTDLGKLEISGLAGRRLRGRFGGTGPKSTYDATLVPELPDRVWVISAKFDAEATPAERDQIYLRILRSVRLIRAGA